MREGGDWGRHCIAFIEWTEDSGSEAGPPEPGGKSGFSAVQWKLAARVGCGKSISNSFSFSSSISINLLY
jgi:hypothetical protein